MSFSSDDEPTMLPAPGSGASDAGSDGPRLADGQIIGPYRIAGLLGLPLITCDTDIADWGRVRVVW